MERYLETDRGMKEYIHGNWVRHEDAQSRIAELEAEVERIKETKNMWRDAFKRVIQERDTAWNDAIEAAAKRSKEAWDSGYDATPHIRSLRR